MIRNFVFRSFIFICKTQKQLSGGVLKKVVLKNFAEFTGKYLCWSLFFLIKLQPEACKFIKIETLENDFLVEITFNVLVTLALIFY